MPNDDSLIDWDDFLLEMSNAVEEEPDAFENEHEHLHVVGEPLEEVVIGDQQNFGLNDFVLEMIEDFIIVRDFEQQSNPHGMGDITIIDSDDEE